MLTTTFVVPLAQSEQWSKERCAQAKTLINNLSQTSREMIREFDDSRDNINLVRNTANRQIAVSTGTSFIGVATRLITAPFKAASRSFSRDSARYQARRHGRNGVDMIEPRQPVAEGLARQNADRAFSQEFNRNAAMQVAGEGAIWTAGNFLALSAADAWSMTAFDIINQTTAAQSEALSNLQNQQREMREQYYEKGCDRFD